MSEPIKGVLAWSSPWAEPVNPNILEDLRKAVKMVEAAEYDYCGSETTPHVVAPHNRYLCINCGASKPNPRS